MKELQGFGHPCAKREASRAPCPSPGGPVGAQPPSLPVLRLQGPPHCGTRQPYRPPTGPCLVEATSHSAKRGPGLLVVPPRNPNSCSRVPGWARGCNIPGQGFRVHGPPVPRTQTWPCRNRHCAWNSLPRSFPIAGMWGGYLPHNFSGAGLWLLAGGARPQGPPQGRKKAPREPA